MVFRQTICVLHQTILVLRQAFSVSRQTFLVVRQAFSVVRQTILVVRQTFYVLRKTILVFRQTFYALRQAIIAFGLIYCIEIIAFFISCFVHVYSNQFIFISPLFYLQMQFSKYHPFLIFL
ncbi:MAG: hypothetical protein WCH21_12600 [Bacteroidota bacterium]